MTAHKLCLLQKQNKLVIACSQSTADQCALVQGEDPAAVSAGRLKVKASHLKSLRVIDLGPVRKSAEGLLLFLDLHLPRHPAFGQTRPMAYSTTNSIPLSRAQDGTCGCVL